MNDAKQWLCRYRAAAAEWDALISRIAALKVKASAPAPSALDGMPRAPSRAGDRIGLALARIDELEQEATAVRDRCKGLYAEITAAAEVFKVAGGTGWADRKAVIQMRYLDLASWPEIAKMLFGARGDFDDRFESYLRRVHRLHVGALIELAEILDPEGAGQEKYTNGRTRK